MARRAEKPDINRLEKRGECPLKPSLGIPTFDPQRKKSESQMRLINRHAKVLVHASKAVAPIKRKSRHGLDGV
jgi:hypothetical protein